MEDRVSEDNRFAFGLTEVEVRRLQDILIREGEPDTTLNQAWERAVELLSLFRMLLDATPSDRAAWNERGSNILRIDDSSQPRLDRSPRQ